MPSQNILNCSKALAEQELTLAFVESATAGRLAAEFSLTPDSGKILMGGLVCYDANLKIEILRVPKELIEGFTPESAEVTKELAERLQTYIPADIHVAITGLTTPGGSETPEKPVGTIFIYAIVKGKPIALREVFQGGPEQIVLQAVDRVALLLHDQISVRPSHAS
ncbi:CinA family protein [Dyadobacter pollutisoli]|uniref:CinA family protein n=1 Tax=Dyadobacter pollutisoli TaxID=2910158 RepID=A0A9E8SMN0_9BACT|nr:CinA family protein [Dyadobacter pollutisoli]WAC13484.1 CinA family protein [Dyadobacter pollutisoli]